MLENVFFVVVENLLLSMYGESQSGDVSWSFSGAGRIPEADICIQDGVKASVELQNNLGNWLGWVVHMNFCRPER